MKCKISEHIPTENGNGCECGYFWRAKSSYFSNEDEYAKHVRDTISDYKNFRDDVRTLVIEDVPHEHQGRLLELLSDKLTHKRHLELI